MATHGTELDHLHVRYATFREHSVDERVADAARFAHLEASQRVLIQTCHRVELVSLHDSEPADDTRHVRGRPAVQRVFEVVAGFDSAVVAEEQVIGQVRTAYEQALAAGTTGPILNELFRRALRFGRRVRSHARPGADRSLADRGADWLIDRMPAEAQALVAGTGEMGRMVARRLAEAGHRLTIASASPARATKLRDELPGGPHRVEVGPLGAEVTRAHSAIAIAVRPSAPVVYTEHVEPAPGPWILDLSAPPAVSADAAGFLGDRLLGLDRLAGLAAPSATFAPAVEQRLRRELSEEVDRFVAWIDSRRASDALALLHHEAEAVRRRHLDRLRRGGRLAPEQLAAVEAASAAMVGELLHGPSVELRRGGADASTVRRLFGLDA